MTYYNKNEIYGEKHFQIPKVLFTNPLYRNGLTDKQRIAFGMLKDRFNLSVANEWFDEEGRIYFIFSQEELMLIFDCSKQTASDIKKALVKCNLLEIKRRGQGLADLLYLKKPIVNDNDVYLIKRAETLGAVEKSKNQTSRSLKTRPLEVQKLDAINTDINKTEINKTEIKEKDLKESVSHLTDELLSKYLPEIDYDRRTDFYKAFEFYQEKLDSFDMKCIINKISQYQNIQVRTFKRYLNTVIVNYIKEKEPTPVVVQTKSARKEYLPDWFEENPKEESKPRMTEEEISQKTAEIDEMLKQLDESAEIAKKKQEIQNKLKAFRGE